LTTEHSTALDSFGANLNTIKLLNIGLSKRRIGVRKKEHIADCSKPLNEESAMAHHCICESHKIDDQMELLKEVNEFYKLNVWESLFLFKHSNLNLQNIYKEGNSPSILFQAL
jgi:hypothetical protein